MNRIEIENRNFILGVSNKDFRRLEQLEKEQNIYEG